LKIEFNRKEEVKHKEECIQKLDEKAVLLNLKKEDEQLKENKDDIESLIIDLTEENPLLRPSF